MAVRNNISLLDGKATPVSHVFSPNSGDGNVPGVSVISWEDRSGGIAVGFPTLTISTRKPSKTNRNYKISVVLTAPVMEVVSNSTVSGIAPAPTVAYSPIFRGEFILPERSTLDSRKDIYAFAKNLFSSATFTSAIETLDTPW